MHEAPPAPKKEAPEPPPKSSGGSFWAQRFSAGAGDKPAPMPAPPPPAAAPADGPGGDPEATIQQPALPRRPSPKPRPKPGPPQEVEGATEQLPRVEAEARNDADGTAMMAYPPQAAEPEGTAMMAYPPQAAEPEGTAMMPYPQQADADRDDDPYDDFDSYGDPREYQDAQDYDDYGDDYAEPRDRERARDYDDYDPEAPAGLDSDDYLSDEDDADDDEERSPTKEWGTLVLQGGVGVVSGIGVWFAFNWLWLQLAPRRSLRRWSSPAAWCSSPRSSCAETI
ncbi:hypothetical protein ACFQ0O_35925 [Saccharopolyspora spinosporotrichia]